MLNLQDLNKLQPYLAIEKVVNMEVKENPSRRNVKAKRKILLEYEDGTKLIGDLNADVFTMNHVKGLTTITRNFARGKHFGKNSWRGNFSGLFLKSLLESNLYLSCYFSFMY